MVELFTGIITPGEIHKLQELQHNVTYVTGNYFLLIIKTYEVYYVTLIKVRIVSPIILLWLIMLK